MDAAPHTAKDPVPHELIRQREGHDEKPHEKVGHRERRDEPVLQVLERLFRRDGDDHEHIADHDDDHHESEDDGGDDDVQGGVPSHRVEHDGIVIRPVKRVVVVVQAHVIVGEVHMHLVVGGGVARHVVEDALLTAAGGYLHH